MSNSSDKPGARLPGQPGPDRSDSATESIDLRRLRSDDGSGSGDAPRDRGVKDPTAQLPTASGGFEQEPPTAARPTYVPPHLREDSGDKDRTQRLSRSDDPYARPGSAAGSGQDPYARSGSDARDWSATQPRESSLARSDRVDRDSSGVPGRYAGATGAGAAGVGAAGAGAAGSSGAAYGGTGYAQSPAVERRYGAFLPALGAGVVTAAIIAFLSWLVTNGHGAQRILIGTIEASGVLSQDSGSPAGHRQTWAWILAAAIAGVIVVILIFLAALSARRSGARGLLFFAAWGAMLPATFIAAMLSRRADGVPWDEPSLLRALGQAAVLTMTTGWLPGLAAAIFRFGRRRTLD